MRRWISWMAVVCAACTGGGSSENLGSAAEALISDGAHSGGTTGFYFLPPMVDGPTVTGDFEPRLSPRVVIDEVVPATGAVTRRVVVFAMAGQGGTAVGVGASETLRVDAAGGHYHVNFHTDLYDLDPTRYYRVRVVVGGRELGFADLDVVDSGRELRHVDRGLYIPLLDGRTLPIKFRIERFVVDHDHDDVFDDVDRCPTVADPAQLDTDGDGRGDACECLAVACAAADDCHRPGACDPTTGGCDAPLAPDDATCVAAPSPAAIATCQQGVCTRRPDAIELTPTTAVIAVGDVTPIAATALDSAGLPIADAALTYQVADGTVGVYDAAGGTFAATGPGVTALTAAAGGAQGSATLLSWDASCGVVIHGPTAGGSPALLGPGQVLSLRLEFQIPNRPSFDATAFATWSSSNPSVATVSGGAITAGASGGTTTITAALGGLTASFDVVDIGGSTTLVLTGGGLPSGMWVGPGDTGATGTAVAVINPGQTTELVATFNTISVPGVNTQGYVQWASSDPSVATVSSAGTVTALGGGFAVITGSFGGLTGQLGLVSAPPRSRARSCRGGGWGDPHLVTHDGLGYDLQAAGEFLLAANPIAGVEVHARLEPVGAAGTDDLSLISAVATRVDGHALAMADEHAAFLRIDGDPVEVPAGGVFFAGGGRIERFGQAAVEVQWPGGEAVAVTTGATSVGRPLSVQVCRGLAPVGAWRGLLGNGNGLTSDDLTGADGSAYTAPVSWASWQAFTGGWRLTGSSALLHYPAGTSAATFQLVSFPGARRGVASLATATRTWADGVCRAGGLVDAWLLAACTLDVGATGDAAYAAMATAVEPPALAVAADGTCVPGSEACAGDADLCEDDGVATDCDDGDPCTVDSCVSATGCAHAPNLAVPACAPTAVACKGDRAAGYTTSGLYTIDPDGPGTGVAPFVVWCDMTRQGGGWTLFARHRHGVGVVARNLIQLDSYGVIDDARWRALRDTFTDGFMFVDEYSRISRVSRANLIGGNCHSILSVGSLVEGRPGAAPNGILWHNENAGCNRTGLDYSVVVLAATPVYGASVYQMSASKFDLWPYASFSASYLEQDELWYYIR